MTRKVTGDSGNDSYIDKILDSVNEKENIDGERHRHEHNEKHSIGNEHENAPDEGKEDVPTEDKIIRDPETGEETFIKNDNKNWKLK